MGIVSQEALLPGIERAIPPDGVICPRLERLSSMHPKTQLWRQFADKIFDILTEHKHYNIAIPGFWAYSLWGRDQIIFAILLGRRDISSGYGFRIRDKVTQVLDEHVGQQILRFYQLTVGPCSNDRHHSTFEGPMLDYHARAQWEHSLTAQIGYSLGPELDSTAGSLCGFVRLIDPKTNDALSDQFALTCHHVVDPDCWNPLEKDSVVTHCPSPADSLMTYKALLISCRENKQKRGKILDEMENLPDEALEAMGDKKSLVRLANRRTSLNYFDRQLEQCAATIQRLKVFETMFGNVFASSGDCSLFPEPMDSVQYPMAIDWALIRLIPGRSGENQLNRTREPHPSYSELPTTGMSVSDNGGIENEEIVIKYGRTSGWSQGRIEPDRLSYHFRDRKRADYSIKENTAKVRAFSTRGDSGAAVLNNDGQCIGMITKGTEELPGDRSDITFFTSWNDIARDVLAKTGYVMEWITEAHTTSIHEHAATEAEPPSRIA